MLHSPAGGPTAHLQGAAGSRRSTFQQGSLALQLHQEGHSSAHLPAPGSRREEQPLVLPSPDTSPFAPFTIPWCREETGPSG